MSFTALRISGLSGVINSFITSGDLQGSLGRDGATVGVGVGVGIGAAVGEGVGVTVGLGVGVGVNVGVGVGLGVGVGVGVLAVHPPTIIATTETLARIARRHLAPPWCESLQIMAALPVPSLRGQPRESPLVGRHLFLLVTKASAKLTHSGAPCGAFLSA